MLKFTEAKLTYGVRAYPVEKNEHFSPFEDFDPKGDLMEQVFKAIAMMSNASGGHTLRDAKVRVHPTFVSIIGNGFSIKWGEVDPTVRAIANIEQRAIEVSRIFNESVVYDVPFAVRTDQYGDGWKRAIKC